MLLEGDCGKGVAAEKAFWFEAWRRRRRMYTIRPKTPIAATPNAPASEATITSVATTIDLSVTPLSLSSDGELVGDTSGVGRKNHL